MARLLGGNYDVLVYGAGIAPTMCAALLSQKGRSVLLISPEGTNAEELELEEGPAVPAVLSGLNEGYPVYQAFQELGLIEGLPWRKCETLAQVLTPHFRVKMNISANSAFSDELRIELSGQERLDLERLLRVINYESPLRNSVRAVMCTDPSRIRPRRKVLDAMRRHLGTVSKEITDTLVTPVAAFNSHSVPVNMPPEEAALVLALQGEGIWRLDQGVGAIIERLIKSIHANGSDVLIGTEVASIVMEQKKVSGLLLSSFEGVVKGSQVVIGEDLRVLYGSIPLSLQDTNYVYDLSRVENSHIEHTVVFEINEDALPRGMAEDVVYLSDPTLPLEGENYLTLRSVKSGRGTIYVFATVLVPERVAKTQPKSLRRLSAMMLRKMEEIMPFVEYNIRQVWPDFRHAAVSESVRRPGKARYYVRGGKLRQGFNAVSIATPHDNMHACGGLIWPSLGLYGEALSGLRAAEAVLNLRI